jgi:hypothetical protein
VTTARRNSNIAVGSIGSYDKHALVVAAVVVVVLPQPCPLSLPPLSSCPCCYIAIAHRHRRRIGRRGTRPFKRILVAGIWLAVVRCEWDSSAIIAPLSSVGTASATYRTQLLPARSVFTPPIQRRLAHCDACTLALLLAVRPLCPAAHRWPSTTTRPTATATAAATDCARLTAPIRAQLRPTTTTPR